MKKRITFTVTLVLSCLFLTLFAAPAQAHLLDLSSFASNLYEPKTSVVLPATIAWPADSNAIEQANAEVRPNTVFVRVDRNLAVKSMNGFTISESLINFLRATKDNTLQALYIEDDETATKLVDFIQATNAADIFVVANSANRALVHKVASCSPSVYGIVDFSDINSSEVDLGKVVAETHAADARIALIPESIATRENIDYLRGRLTSVWVATAANEKSIYTQLTNGANGIYCEDYEMVIKALESFNQPNTLLRPSFIAGHRGLPSEYVENTISSAKAAVAAGADVIETDIYLSKDNEIFILHDSTLERLFNHPEVTNVSDLTLEELQSFAYDMTDEDPEKAPNSVLNSNNENRTKEGRENLEINYDPEVDVIPSFRDYLNTFKDEDVLHFIEIKTDDPAIIPVLRSVCEELDVVDQIICISFNDGFYYGGQAYPTHYPEYDVLSTMHELWPSMPQGYLGYDFYVFSDHDSIIEEDGHTGNAVGQLLGATEPHNATYNPYFKMMSYDTVVGGRHRGVTVWPWTYNNELDFANAYLSGIYGITTNYTTWASDYAKKFEVYNTRLLDGDLLEFKLLNQKGEEMSKRNAELVVISGISLEMGKSGKIKSDEVGQALVMLKYSDELDVNKADLSELGDTNYTLYSNPFIIEIVEPEAN